MSSKQSTSKSNSRNILKRIIHPSHVFNSWNTRIFFFFKHSRTSQYKEQDSGKMAEWEVLGKGLPTSTTTALAESVCCNNFGSLASVEVYNLIEEDLEANRGWFPAISALSMLPIPYLQTQDRQLCTCSWSSSNTAFRSKSGPKGVSSKYWGSVLWSLIAPSDHSLLCGYKFAFL